MGTMTASVAAFRPGNLRALASDLIDRLRFARQAGITFDGKRDEYEIFGYDRVITLQQYRDEFARGGIAKRIVNALPNATWRGRMELVEDEDSQKETKFEKAWSDLDRKHKISAVLRRVDILAGLGYYAVLLIGAPGELDTELPKGSPEKLLYLTPYAGGGGPGLLNTSVGSFNGAGNLAYGDASIAELEVDPSNPRFGLPKTYQLRRIDVSSPDMQKPVHWSRIVHVAEGCLDNELYGTPVLEAVWNLLIDLRKVTGGGAESFFQRANQGLLLNLDKDADLDTEASNKLKDEVEEYRHNISRILKTRGMEVKTLGSDVANFQNPADAILTQIAGTTTIPKRILTGSEMGELASSQDRDNWKDQINGRQESYAGPYIVRPLVDRLIAYGYMPAPSKGPDIYEVVWPHIQTLTEQEKADGAAKWTSANSTQGSPIFTCDEIRDKWYGFGPLTPEQLKKEMEAKSAAQAAAQPPAPAGAPGAPAPGDPAAEDGEVAPESVVDALLDDEDEDPKEEPKALGGPGSGVQGHTTAGDDPVAKEVSKWSAALARAGGSLRRSTTRSSAQIAHKKQEDADRTARKATRKLATKGFKPFKDGDGTQFVHEDGRKAIVSVDRKFRVSITVIKAKKKAEEEPKAAGEHKYASVQVALPEEIAKKMQALGTLVDDSDLTAKGLEDDPHVTVKSGFVSDDPFTVERALGAFDTAQLTMGETDYFEGDEYDVVFVKVDSPDLVAMNKALSSQLDTVTTHPTYTPHATIAYVKPGFGAKYAGMSELSGMSIETASVVFSPAEGPQSVIDLGLRAAAEDEELLKVLEAAIIADNEEVIASLIGVTHKG